MFFVCRVHICCFVPCRLQQFHIAADHARLMPLTGTDALSRASRERTNRSQKAVFQTQRLRLLGMASRRSLQFILCPKPREFQKSSTLRRTTAWGAV